MDQKLSLTFPSQSRNFTERKEEKKKLNRNMVLLCFILDLRSLSPPVLRDVKQSLLQLANYYAVSCPKISNSVDGTRSNSKPLLDRIGLCYVLRNRITCSDELKVAYNPQGNFNLRDLHHALNTMPTDAFSHESDDSEALCMDMKLADILSEKTIYTWGGHNKNVARKVIWISSFLVGTMHSMTMKALMDAADKCILVELILLEQTPSCLGDVTDRINQVVEQIGSLKNCSCQTFVPDTQVLYGLAKRWFQELTDDREEPLQALFVFKTNLMNRLNQISCNLSMSFIPVIDEFNFCQTCRCHGIPLDGLNVNQTKRSSCPVTSENLGVLDIIENSARVGEQTILYLPSFMDRPKLTQVSSPIELNVIQRTNLGTLSEGLIMGATCLVTPTSYHSDENDKSELNRKFFQVVCRVLNSLDQGLVCSSTCNIETATGTSFPCYYILLPSDKGLMLLRRLSASEEFMPIPDVTQLITSVVAEEIENTVKASLLKVEETDYNPVQHERGFHKKLNTLVKESLHFRAIHPISNEGISGSDLDQQNSESQVQASTSASGKTVPVDEQPQYDSKPGEKKTSPCLSEEWEQLIVTNLEGIRSPTCISNSKIDQLLVSPSQSTKQLDEKTSRILERLEVPKQLKRKVVSPTISCSLSADVCGPLKKPLIPYKTNDGPDHGLIPSQPIKPTFQRLKRKK